MVSNVEKTAIVKAMSDYVELGLPIIPLCSHDHVGMSPGHIKRCNCPGKIPLIKGWQLWSDTTEDNLQEWLDSFGFINVGLPLGDASGYVGVDIDGEFGESELETMSAGDVPETWEYNTGAGRRLIYQIPVGMKTKKFKSASKEEGHAECALLCTGQQTVIPPSIHHTGVIYSWEEGHSPFDIDCAPAPQWIIDKIKITADTKPSSILIKKSPGQLAVEKAKINVGSPAALEYEFETHIPTFLDELPITDTSVTGNKVCTTTQVDLNLTDDELNAPIPDGQRDSMMTRIVGSFCARYRNLGKERILLLALDHNERYCQPPLEREAIEAKVNHIWELEQMKSNQFKDQMEKRLIFEPNKLAQTILNVWEETGMIVRAQSDADTLWCCDKDVGPWRSISGRSSNFFAMFSNIISNPQYGGQSSWTTTQRLKDVGMQIFVKLHELGLTWNADSGNIDTQSDSASQYIPLADGKLLDWKTGDLIPWDPKYFFTYTIPVTYDPGASCPYWEARLIEWLPDEGARKILQEFIGYSLVPYMGFEKAILLLGEGANGKSIFLESIQAMLGHRVTGACSMQTIFSHFGLQHLQGKILNICNEAGSEYLRSGNADLFKNLVSGGRVVADVKNQTHSTFNNTAKFIFSANHDIKTNDKSAGWTRRLLIIPFNQNFEGSPVTKSELMTNIKAEYSGIFNWAIEGLRRLMEQRDFSSSVEVSRKIAEYKAENDVADDFFQNCLKTFNPKYFEVSGIVGNWGTPVRLVSDLFELWVRFKESSIQKQRKHIKDYLEKKHGLESKRTSRILYSNAKQTVCWIGLQICIHDAEFLEVVQAEGDQILRELAIKELKHMDEQASA